MGEKRIFDNFGIFEGKKEYLIILEIFISSVVFIYLFQETKEFDLLLSTSGLYFGKFCLFLLELSS